MTIQPTIGKLADGQFHLVQNQTNSQEHGHRPWMARRRLMRASLDFPWSEW